jgi:hypothetical protein
MITKTMKAHAKGQQMNMAVEFIVVLGFAALLGGAFAIALAGFGDSTTNATADAIIANGSSGILNMSVQLPVVGTVGGVALIIAVIVGALFASVGGILALKR